MRPFARSPAPRYNARMQLLNTSSRKRQLFDVLTQTRCAQAAMMTLCPGQSSSDEPENEHPKAEQWLFVLTGSGRAIVGKRRVALKEGSLLLIEKGELHQITNTGREQMVTFNLYCPPAYDADGEVKASVK
jgi:mannose-6-phosphate isomerase-like protein (cupin superfamily)